MSDGFSVVTLCTGNVHRSALAAALLRQWAQWYLRPELAGVRVRRQRRLRGAGGHPDG